MAIGTVPRPSAPASSGVVARRSWRPARGVALRALEPRRLDPPVEPPPERRVARRVLPGRFRERVDVVDDERRVRQERGDPRVEPREKDDDEVEVPGAAERPLPRPVAERRLERPPARRRPREGERERGPPEGNAPHLRGTRDGGYLPRPRERLPRPSRVRRAARAPRGAAPPGRGLRCSPVFGRRGTTRRAFRAILPLRRGRRGVLPRGSSRPRRRRPMRPAFPPSRRSSARSARPALVMGERTKKVVRAPAARTTPTASDSSRVSGISALLVPAGVARHVRRVERHAPRRGLSAPSR